MQADFYDKEYFETDLQKNCPDFVKLSQAYNVMSFRADTESAFLEALNESVKILKNGQSVVIEVIININEKVKLDMPVK